MSLLHPVPGQRASGSNKEMYSKTERRQIKSYTKDKGTWADETAQQLRSLGALPEAPGSIPSTHIHDRLMVICDFGSRASDAFLWSLQAPGPASVAQIYMQTKHLFTHKLFF